MFRHDLKPKHGGLAFAIWCSADCRELRMAILRPLETAPAGPSPYLIDPCMAGRSRLCASSKSVGSRLCVAADGLENGPRRGYRR